MGSLFLYINASHNVDRRKCRDHYFLPFNKIHIENIENFYIFLRIFFIRITKKVRLSANKK